MIDAMLVIEDAASCLAGLAYKCITLDLNLGEEQGITLLHEISRHAPGATVFLISGADAPARKMAIHAARQLDLKVIDVPKPMDLRKLRIFLDEVSGWSSGHAASAAVA
jgi:DNA-binding NtrC family response regulator